MPEKDGYVDHPEANLKFRSPDTLIGAIRWDGYVGDKDKVGKDIEKVLAPEKYHHRLPFYSRIKASGQVEVRCTDQQSMDCEIAYAKEAGIDYWAFDWYSPDSALSTARSLYLFSAHKNDVKWCVILGTWRFDETDLDWLIGQFKMENYQKVLDGRPLVYVFAAKKNHATQIRKWREKAAQAGVPTPYIVLMGWGAGSGRGCESLRCGRHHLLHMHPL